MKPIPLDLSDRIQTEVTRIVPPPKCVSETAIRQLTPLFEEVFSLRAENAQLRAENERKETALIRLRDCDWVITLPDRMDAVRKIAGDALAPPSERDTQGEDDK